MNLSRASCPRNLPHFCDALRRVWWRCARRKKRGDEVIAADCSNVGDQRKRAAQLASRVWESGSDYPHAKAAFSPVIAWHVSPHSSDILPVHVHARAVTYSCLIAQEIAWRSCAHEWSSRREGALIMSMLQTKCDRSYPLVSAKLVTAVILPSAGDACEGCPAELQEISQGSAKLLVNGPPELWTYCRIRLSSANLERPLELPAQLDWARPNPAGDWLVECEFQPRLTSDQFARLLSSGLLERRSAVRLPTRIPVEVQCGPKRVPGIVRDLSEGGLCLCLVTRESPPRTRDVTVIANTPRGEVGLGVKVRWTLQVGEEYLIGCQFRDGTDFDLLRGSQTKDSVERQNHL
jgi:hypothetical protein